VPRDDGALADHPHSRERQRDAGRELNRLWQDQAQCAEAVVDG